MLRGFFDRHMKLRIALQLLLDVTPMVLLAGAVAALYRSRAWEPAWQTALITVALWAFVFLTVPLFIASVLTGRRLPEFEVYPFWGRVSLALHCLAVIPMVMAAFLDLCVIATVLDIAISLHIPIVQFAVSILFR